MYAKLVLRSPAVRGGLPHLPGDPHPVRGGCSTPSYPSPAATTTRTSGAEFDLTFLSDGMKVAVCGVTLLLWFLIRYVNRYMLRQKQPTLAIQGVLGMESRTMALALLRRDLLRQPAGPGAGDPPGGGPLPVHHRPAAGQLRPALPADLLPLSGHGGPYPGLFRGELPGDGAVSRPVHPADASAGHAPGHPAQRRGPAAQPVDAGGHRPLPPGPGGDGSHGGVAAHPVRRPPPPLARAGAVLGQRPAPPGGGGRQPGVAGAAEGLGLSPGCWGT